MMTAPSAVFRSAPHPNAACLIVTSPGRFFRARLQSNPDTNKGATSFSHHRGVEVHQRGHIVRCGWIGTPSLRKSALSLARREQDRCHGAIPFDAAGLVVNAIFAIGLPREFLTDGPWPCPHRRILDRNLVGEGVRTGPGPALDKVQILSRALIVGFRAE